MGIRKITKVTAIVQARMGSSRLPGKVLMPLAGFPSLWWINQRLLLSKEITHIVVATSTNINNNPIVKFCIDNEISWFSGSEEDVLQRVTDAAEMFGHDKVEDIVIDITADCPLIDPVHIDHLVKELVKHNYDYISNCYNRYLPDGFDVQVYRRFALEEVNRIVKKKEYRQHSGWLIPALQKERPNEVNFKIGEWFPKGDCYYPHWGLTLDEAADYKLLKKVLNHFKKDISFSAEDVIKFLHKSPHLLKINSHIKRKIPGEL